MFWTVYEIITKLEHGIDETSQKSVAEKLDISPQYLHDIINYRRSPGKKVLNYFGLKRMIIYVEKSDNE